MYAVGLGKLSKAAALLSEAISISIDAGLHRSADTYDLFDPIEDEIRKRTFWCVYMWDKQLSAHFGRPPMIRLRDCDIGEPAIIDDEYITREGIVTQPAGTESRMSAFVAIVRMMVVLESVLDILPSRQRVRDGSPFLMHASGMLYERRRHKDLREEEGLLEEIRRSVPTFWAHTSESLSSEDVLRVTQAVRLHCVEQYVRMLIHRQRLSIFVAERVRGGLLEEEAGEGEREAMVAAQGCALQIISSHLQVAAKGLMTYCKQSLLSDKANLTVAYADGVHVIHQLTQAGRTLVAVVVNCRGEKLQGMVEPALDGIRSCVGLLRRFSGRYVCGQRSGDLMEEFCRREYPVFCWCRSSLLTWAHVTAPNQSLRSPWSPSAQKARNSPGTARRGYVRSARRRRTRPTNRAATAEGRTTLAPRRFPPRSSLQIRPCLRLPRVL